MINFTFTPLIKKLGRAKSTSPTLSINSAGNVYIGEVAIKMMGLEDQELAVLRLMEDRIHRVLGFQVLQTSKSISEQLDTSIRIVKIHTAKSGAKFITVSIRRFLKNLGITGSLNRLKLTKHTGTQHGELWYIRLPKLEFKNRSKIT